MAKRLEPWHENVAKRQVKSPSRGFELKLTSSPRVTPSMRAALEDLKLEELVVIHAGSESYSLASRIRAVALARLASDIPPL